CNVRSEITAIDWHEITGVGLDRRLMGFCQITRCLRSLAYMSLRDCIITSWDVTAFSSECCQAANAAFVRPMSARGPYQTSSLALHMAAFDPKRVGWDKVLATKSPATPRSLAARTATGWRYCASSLVTVSTIFRVAGSTSKILLSATLTNLK